MIIVRLKGGLGNQMFQYACGRALSIERSQPLFLDLTELRNPPRGITRREYGLGAFRIVAEEATPLQVERILYRHGLMSRIRLQAERAIWRRLPFFREAIPAEAADIYLDGYWQKESYFRGIRSELLEDFRLKAPLDGQALQISAEIQASNRPTVSIHIRRGDYISLPSARRHHGVCPPEYYERALTYVEREVGDLRCFVFSDDVAWCLNDLQLPRAFTVIPAGISDAESIYLMSLCQHHIVANSSFSWWGAWIGRHNGITTAPLEWLAGKSSDELEICPASWIQM